MMSRRDEALKLRGVGLSYRKIGLVMGISDERVRQLVSEAKPKMAKPDSNVMLTTSGVAQLLGIHINTVRRWSNSGILRAYRISPRGDRRFRRADIDSFLELGKWEVRDEGNSNANN